MNQRELEATIYALEQALEHAKSAGFDVHFTSEISHLIATAKANREEEQSE